MDYEIQRCTRRCAATDRELRPGETYYSVLTLEGVECVRRDYCADAWTGPPEGVLGWWKSRVPDPQARKPGWAPNEVMISYLQELSARGDAEDTLYVLALLMIRRRLLRWEETERDAVGREKMVLYSPLQDAEYRVPCIELSTERMAAIQEELAQLLFAVAD